MYEALCEQTHQQLLAGTCPWCGREIVRAAGRREPEPDDDVQVVQVQLPQPLKVELHVEINLDDQPETVAEALLTISAQMELEGYPSTDIFVIHMAVEGALAVVRKQGKHPSTIVGCSIEPDKVFVHFKS